MPTTTESTELLKHLRDNLDAYGVGENAAEMLRPAFDDILDAMERVPKTNMVHVFDEIIAALSAVPQTNAVDALRTLLTAFEKQAHGSLTAEEYFAHRDAARAVLDGALPAVPAEKVVLDVKCRCEQIRNSQWMQDSYPTLELRETDTEETQMPHLVCRVSQSSMDALGGASADGKTFRVRITEAAEGN